MAKGDVDTYFDDGKWKNKVEGNSRASNVHDRKADAQAVGRDMAIGRGVEHVIKNMDGTIGSKNTYPRSRDQRPPKG
jgi:hypothetical protein